MKKIVILLTALLMFSTSDADAQGFLKKLKQKAQQAVGLSKTEESEQTTENDDKSSADVSNLTVAQGSDIVPKRKTVTITWDGTVTPSSASSASALMSELPQLPSAEKMARSTMEERDAYINQIASVLARAEQLQEANNGCSDAEMEALRLKWEQKIQELFGLTKEELTMLNDENVADSKKEPIRQKILVKVTGTNPDMAEMERFEKMSEKEQENYIRQHPEFMQKMQAMAMNARNFSQKTKQMTEAFNGYEAKMGKLMQDYLQFMERENQHSYSNIGKKYSAKLRKYYDQICATDDAAQIDALYADADEILYKYRLEAAKEFRASLVRQIAEAKKIAAEYSRLTQQVVNSGDLPECAIGRMDLNAVIAVGNLLGEAYKELPKLDAQPVCAETLYELPNGWTFCYWESGGYVGGVDDFKIPGSQWPLLAFNERTKGYGAVERGKFRLITEEELKAINKQADARQKKGTDQKPPYGVYKSRSGKRSVEYSQTGEVIINGMTTFTPSAFSISNEKLEWIVVDEGKILKCTYKL